MYIDRYTHLYIYIYLHVHDEKKVHLCRALSEEPRQFLERVFLKHNKRVLTGYETNNLEDIHLSWRTNVHSNVP